jgi:hypothetical protein
MQYPRLNEVREALQEAIDQLAQASVQLKKDSKEYYFADKEQISWRVSYDVLCGHAEYVYFAWWKCPQITGSD